MRKLKLTTGILAIAFVTFTAISCKDSKKEHDSDDDQTEVSDDNGAGHHDNDDEGETSHTDGGHMAHMNDVKAWLKEELGDSYEDQVPVATKEQLEKGKLTFHAMCAACHGATGKGDGAAAAGFTSKPADFTDPSHSAFYSDMGRIHIITNGVKGTPMIGWSPTLNEDEIMAVYLYCRSLRNSDESGDLGEGMYTCSMHPEVSGNKGGKCPKCGMTLIPKKQEDKDDGHDHEH
jgi:mono/diheme cytochrome c family protein